MDAIEDVEVDFDEFDDDDDDVAADIVSVVVDIELEDFDAVVGGWRWMTMLIV